MKRILVVDDDRNQRILYEQELADAGYEVAVSANGREALASLSRREPDLVVLDIAMPGMDGIETMGRITSMAPTIPVVLHSAYTSYRNNFMTWSADAYVVKSSDPTKLISTVRTLLHDVDDLTVQAALGSRLAEQPRSGDREQIGCGTP